MWFVSLAQSDVFPLALSKLPVLPFCRLRPSSGSPRAHDGQRLVGTPLGTVHQPDVTLFTATL